MPRHDVGAVGAFVGCEERHGVVVLEEAAGIEEGAADGKGADVFLYCGFGVEVLVGVLV